MSYEKRISSPKTWITPRKGTKYLTSPYPGKLRDLSMPLSIFIRDLLKLAITRREVKIMINQKEILVNGVVMKTEKFPVGIFDVLSIPKIKKNYKVFINEKKRFDLEEIKESETKAQTYKVVGKTSLRGGKTQFNLFNGRNVLSDDKKIKVNDSVVVEFAKGKIVKHLPMKEGSKVYIVGGTHLGSNGVIDKLSSHTANVKLEKGSFELKMENVYATS